ncbi:hypothetical protein R6Q57_009102 [Mikania cordata]
MVTKHADANGTVSIIRKIQGQPIIITEHARVTSIRRQSYRSSRVGSREEAPTPLLEISGSYLHSVFVRKKRRLRCAESDFEFMLSIPSTGNGLQLLKDYILRHACQHQREKEGKVSGISSFPTDCHQQTTSSSGSHYGHSGNQENARRHLRLYEDEHERKEALYGGMSIDKVWKVCGR